jgi:hypothetical protein
VQCPMDVWCFAGRDVRVASLKHSPRTVNTTEGRRWSTMATKFADDPGSWSELADFATDRGHADWRNDILSFVLYAPDPPLVLPVVTPLRPAV